MKKLLLFIYVFALMLVFHQPAYMQTGCDGKRILFIGDDNTALGDSAIEEHIIENLGFELTYQNFSDVVVDDVLTYDMVLMSSTISSGDAAALADVEVPILCMESYSLDNELKMVEDPDEAGYSTFANVPYVNDDENSFNTLIVNQGDSTVAIGLDAGYAGDTIVVFTQDVPYGNNRHPGQWGVPNENAYLILEFTSEALDRVLTEDFTICGTDGGDFCENPRYAAFAYPKDAEMAYDGTPAPEKRGFFFFHEYSAAAATQETWDVFNAMIYWFLGCLDRPITSIRNSEAFANNVSVYPNPTDGEVTLTLGEKGSDDYSIEVYNLLGKKVFQAIVKGAEPSDLRFNLEDPGFYLLKIRSGNKKTMLIKKIIRR